MENTGTDNFLPISNSEHHIWNIVQYSHHCYVEWEILILIEIHPC